jgi:hypothetical protein
MNHLRKIMVTCLLVAISVLLTSAPASAAVSCHKINAKGTGTDLGGGNTEAVIKGGGLLNGTTKGAFVPQAGGIAGAVVFSTNKGTLTVTVTGTFNAQGDFDVSGPVTSSTGKLAGATGNVTFVGHEDLSTSPLPTFTETVTGKICVDLAP